MILPSKHIPQERSLLTIGAHLLKQLNKPKTVSALWERIHKKSDDDSESIPNLSYDWFVLTLDLLFAMGAINIDEGLLVRQQL